MAGPEAWPVISPGVWLSSARPAFPAPTPGLFLDRDGVIIEEEGYLAAPHGVRLLPGAGHLIAAANAAGIGVVTVTNQSGIDRGYFGWAEFAAVQDRLAELLAAEGASLDGVAACPFHPDATPGYRDAQARWRKPGPRMIEALADMLGLDLARSWLVGDKESDIAAARAAGLKGAILVRTGHGADEEDAALGLAREGFAVSAEADAAGAHARLRAAQLLP